MEFFNDVGTDPLKPSLFELIAQEQLRDLLQPALKYVLAVFAQRYPRYLLRIVNKHEDFYAFIMLIVERHYLRKHNASFAENFYGLKRRRKPFIPTDKTSAAVGGLPTGGKLGDREIWRSLLFLVGVPYIRAKAQDYYEELGGSINPDIMDESGARQLRTLTDPGFKGRVRRLFKAMYPWLNLTYEGWLLVWNVGYLFEKTGVHRPWLAWMGIEVRRLGVKDMMAQAPAPGGGGGGGLGDRLREMPRHVLESLRLVLPTAIFFVKFLEWWYSPGSPAKSLSAAALGPAVPPPRLLRPHARGVGVDVRAYGQCPVCKKRMTNASALPSGYVCCYRCAYAAVSKEGRCPVTLVEAGEWQLRKRALSMKFGKHILAHHVPGWSPYYLDYKFLKKIISSLAANRPAADAAALAVGIRPRDSPDRPLADLGNDRGPDFHAHNAAFFFKLERELEKINDFYLRQEAELKLRLETLLLKRRAAAIRGLPDPSDPQNYVEWTAVEEGFRLLERDLGKLQQFIEINAIGFRKILKKFDKRSTSTTKELYLSRQVDVQPVFNRQLISELADTVASCLLDLADLSSGVKFENLAPNDVFTQEILQQHMSPSGPLRDFENNLNNAVASADSDAVVDCVRFSEALGPADVTRILWNVITAAPPDMADLIFASLTNPFDFNFVDDINGRTCLHQAAIVGALKLVDLCIEKGVQVDKADAYGRTALHYASMHDHDLVCRRLLEANLPPDTLDGDNYTPLVYATMKGSVDCVRVLLEEGKVSAQPSSPTQNLQPLSMASQSGHVQIVILLLEHDAQCLPNTNGEYPMHLAAREGHVEICKLLLCRDGWDTPDKYYEWTPLFHAALYGHRECAQVLIEAGARVLATDEFGHTAAHYAGWYGHMNCLDVLLDASSKPPSSPHPQAYEKSPQSDTELLSTSELDLIPSLSLPPPIMPHRVYGHNYLDKAHLIRITIPLSPSQSQVCEPGHTGGVRLHPRLLGPGFRDEHLLASTPLRLVMTTGIDTNPAPYTLLLPQKNEKEVFTFQMPSLEHLSLEFSVYPSFGTMTIGRAIALPSMFINLRNKASFTLPLLDSRLHVVGEVGFEVCIIKAFKGVTLEIGGDIETYWKSLPIPVTPPFETFTKPRHRSTLIESAHTSPSVYSNYGVSAPPTLTISSLQGEYVRVTVQVTKDRQPVIYSDWFLPTADFDLCVCDVTFAQFESLAGRLGRGAETLTGSPESWPASVPRVMVSLAQFFNILPQEFGISIDLAYPAKHVSETRLSRNQLDLNIFVDCILGTIYQVSAPFEVLIRKRRVVFTSFSSDVCAFLNWKQPNYPVFYASSCGQHAESAGGDGDDRTASLGVAIEFASSNNLLGVFVEASLLVRVPSLIHGIRNAGLLVGVHGKAEDYNELITTSQIDSTPVDAYINGGMVIFVDNAMRDVV
ncbi:hypothetical protein APHAL10511_002073 [Amanita phalloides]|nr:hypothetical protein APHAL10511_002073 [Amanita phalloides]